MFFANIFFKGNLEDGEKIQYIVHKHPITFHIKSTKICVLGIVIPVIGLYLFPGLKWLFAAWVIIGCLKFLYLLADWYFDAWLITNQGIIVSEWNGFFDRSHTRIEYHKIDEVSYTIKGILPTLLNFGEVSLTSFGSNMLTQMDKALRPKKVTKIVLSCQEIFIKNKNFRDHETLKNMLADMLQNYNK